MLTWYLSSGYTVPAAGVTSLASFYDTANMWPGSLVVLEDSFSQTMMSVSSVVSSTTAQLINRYYSPNRPSAHVYAIGSSANSVGFDTVPITYAKFNPYDNIPFGTTYPSFNTRGTLGLPVLDCAQSVTTDCIFSDVMPLNANVALGLTTIIRWSSHVAITGNVKWNVAFQRLNQGAGVATSFDTLGTITSVTNGTIDTVNISTIPSLTTISSISAGDLYVVKVTRDGSNGADTMTTDLAEIYSVEVRSAGT